MSNAHQKFVCSCGAVIGQCRCPAADKAIIIIKNGCEKCKKAAGNGDEKLCNRLK